MAAGLHAPVHATGCGQPSRAPPMMPDFDPFDKGPGGPQVRAWLDVTGGLGCHMPREKTSRVTTLTARLLSRKNHRAADLK